MAKQTADKVAKTTPATFNKFNDSEPISTDIRKAHAG